MRSDVAVQTGMKSKEEKKREEEEERRKREEEAAEEEASGGKDEFGQTKKKPQLVTKKYIYHIFD